MELTRKFNLISKRNVDIAGGKGASLGEMKKPCIIGTKNATKVLKDNMAVEVDADNGVVRRMAK